MVVFTAAVASHPLIPARAAASLSLGYPRAAGDVVLPSSKALMLQPMSRKGLGTHRLCCLLLSVAEGCCTELANMLVAPPRCGTGASHTVSATGPAALQEHTVLELPECIGMTKLWLRERIFCGKNTLQESPQ